jgi:hypothetical protein
MIKALRTHRGRLSNPTTLRHATTFKCAKSSQFAQLTSSAYANGETSDLSIYFVYKRTKKLNTMSHEPSTDRKRKPKNILEEMAINDINDGRNPKKENNKTCRVNTKALASTAASLRADTLALTEKAASVATEYELIQSIGKLILDLAHLDNAKVNSALKALNPNLSLDKKKSDILLKAGACFGLVQLLLKCLDKAIDGFPACDQVTELNELAEVTTLGMTLGIIINLTFHNEKSKMVLLRLVAWTQSSLFWSAKHCSSVRVVL